ncbi:MAG: hypothetical protein EBT04_02305 [Betaproteobacteria bacterium]|jgi:hypothetical protein|nr:hypothetical protein [Betaproteobacteria bacterium]
MADAYGKILSTSSPRFVATGSKSALTCTYPKRGQEQTTGTIGQGPWSDTPHGTSVLATYPKRGPKQSI